MSKMSFAAFRPATLAMDGWRVVRRFGDFIVGEREGGKFFVAVSQYPSGGKLPSGQGIEEFDNQADAVRQAQWFQSEYGG